MTPSAERSSDSAPPEGTENPSEADAQRIAQLRGAGVQINGRKLARIMVGLVLLTLAVLVVVSTVAALNNNNRINELHTKGVPVTVTITKCLGLLGGSGGNPAGAACNGAYTLDGHRYVEALPGTTLYAPGAKVPAVAVPSDPTVMSPVAIEAHQVSSGNVFILPAVLLVVFLAIVAAVVWRRRATRAASSPAQDAATAKPLQA